MIGSRKQSVVKRPIARATGLLIETVGDETVVYDLESKEAHCLKSLAAVVFAHADGRNTAAEIAELAEYRLGRTVSEADVADAVAQLEQRALLDTPLVVRDGLSRRDVVQRFAAAAVAAPLIVSVMAPAASAAGSLIATGDCCGDSATSNCTGGNPLCSSGHCCQNLYSKTCNQCKCVGDKNDCELCTAAPGTCPPMTINGVSTTACGATSSGACCYPDAAGNCCTVFVSGGTTLTC
jgi:hypothetical protein